MDERPSVRAGRESATAQGVEPTGPQPEPPHWTLWLLYLYVRPGHFFEHFVLRSVPVLTAISAWAYGIVAVADQVETRALIGELGGRTHPLTALRENWPVFWAACVVLGLASGLLYYFVGGWWYRVRIGFCGDRAAPSALARRVYVFASQAYVIPYIAYTLWETLRYDTPIEAASGDDPGALLVIVFLFWSVYVSYRGVRTVFAVRRWPTRVWFLVLPLVLYGLALVGLFAAVILGANRLEPEPLTSKPQRVERPAFALQYPGNWAVATYEEGFDADHEFGIEPAIADARVNFLIYDVPVDPEVEIAITLSNLTAAFEIRSQTPVERWGRYPGSGYRLEALIDGAPYDLVIFCASSPVDGFEVLQIAAREASSKLRPGFALIRDTFVLRSWPEPPAETQPRDGGASPA